MRSSAARDAELTEPAGTHMQALYEYQRVEMKVHDSDG
jgi:hypothetical protein